MLREVESLSLQDGLKHSLHFCYMSSCSVLFKKKSTILFFSFSFVEKMYIAAFIAPKVELCNGNGSAFIATFVCRKWVSFILQFCSVIFHVSSFLGLHVSMGVKGKWVKLDPASY